MKYCETYAQLRSNRKGSLRAAARHWALNVLGNVEQLRAVDKEAPRVQFIYLHHVFADEEEGLRKILQALSSDFEMVSYSAAVDMILQGKIDRPVLSVSTDDGFKNNIKAAEIFEEFGLKACFFINPLSIDFQDDDELKTFCHTKLHIPPVKFMSWKDIDGLQQRGHEIGSHTMSHIKISNSDAQLVQDEICKSYDVLARRCGEVRHFAYPYGRYFHFNESAMKMVFDAGYDSCASAERGCHMSSGPIQKRDLLIRRDHVIAAWPKSHVKFFLGRNVRNPQMQRNDAPWD